MKNMLTFTKEELAWIEVIVAKFGNQIDSIYVVSKTMPVGGGYDSYEYIRYHIKFKKNIDADREFYYCLSHLFPVNVVNGYLKEAEEYNPYDISSKEVVKIWHP